MSALLVPSVLPGILKGDRARSGDLILKVLFCRVGEIIVVLLKVRRLRGEVTEGSWMDGSFNVSNSSSSSLMRDSLIKIVSNKFFSC